MPADIPARRHCCLVIFLVGNLSHVALVYVWPGVFMSVLGVLLYGRCLAGLSYARSASYRAHIAPWPPSHPVTGEDVTPTFRGGGNNSVSRTKLLQN